MEAVYETISWIQRCPSLWLLLVFIVTLELSIFVLLRPLESRKPKGLRASRTKNLLAPSDPVPPLPTPASVSSPVDDAPSSKAPPEKKLLALKALIPDIDNDAEATNEILSRMLSAREGNVVAALAMYNRWVDFRALYALDAIKAPDVQPLVDSGVAYWHGTDKGHRPAVVILPRKYFPDQHTPRGVIRFALYLMRVGVGKADELKAKEPSLSGQVCVLYDRRGFTMKNFDPGLFGVLKTVVDVIQICYAERLGKMYVLGVNWFFKMMFGIINPLLSAKTRSKIVLLSTSEDLLLYFDRENLEEERLKPLE